MSDISNWIIYNKKKNIKEISQKFGVTPLTSVILCNRNIYDFDEINKILSNDLNDINESKLLPDIDKACEIIFNYIKDKKKIRIVGDYDIDGVCATYILYMSLKELGADVSYHIPNRIQDGYGINVSIIDKAIYDKIDLIITCDNGIAAGSEISYAKENGVSVIVTDHHDITNLPSDALAVVNPKREDLDNKYPFKGICGAVVAWKLMDRLYELYENKKGVIIEKYLEFAMIATIGDIMPIINENHIIAKLGLKKLISTKNKGLNKLLSVVGIDFSKGVTPYHIGFVIGPLINAAGRMDKAEIALKLFISEDDDEINDITSNLYNLNVERKNMTESGVKIALNEIDSKYKNDRVFVIYLEGVGEQVAGIIAGRIKEKYNKPTIIITDTATTEECKASCRSIETYDIFESLSKHSDMFLKFGGHKLAAGFSLMKKDVDTLREKLNEECNLSDEDLLKKVYIDAEFPVNLTHEDIIEDISKLEPYGQEFHRPSFVTKGVKTQIVNTYGAEKNVQKLLFEKDGKFVKGVSFLDYNMFKDDLDRKNNIIDIVYNPKINEFRGERNVEINLIEYR